jgi:hypothetical protein
MTQNPIFFYAQNTSHSDGRRNLSPHFGVRHFKKMDSLNGIAGNTPLNPALIPVQKR